MKKLNLAAALIGVVASAVSMSAGADPAADYPSKTVRIVVPFAPGGATDISARLLAPKLSQSLGQPVIVENRAGAGGTIGSDHAAKAAPDGYTLAFATSSTHGAAPSLYKNLPYDPVQDFEPISLLVSTPFVVAVKKDLPVTSVSELIALAKKSPGKLNYASPGIGSSNQLAVEMLKMMTGVEVVHIPYKGSGPALADLAAGQVDLVINDMASLLGFIKAGTVKPLAVTSLKRNPLLPQLPTVDGSGVRGYEALAWYGLLAPRGTPPAILAKLGNAVDQALRDPDVRKQLEAQGFQIHGDPPDRFRAFMQSEIKKWADVVKASGVRVD